MLNEFNVYAPSTSFRIATSIGIEFGPIFTQHFTKEGQKQIPQIEEWTIASILGKLGERFRWSELLSLLTHIERARRRRIELRR